MTHIQCGGCIITFDKINLYLIKYFENILIVYVYN